VIAPARQQATERLHFERTLSGLINQTCGFSMAGRSARVPLKPFLNEHRERGDNRRDEFQCLSLRLS
jgi:hypothetical protein